MSSMFIGLSTGIVLVILVVGPAIAVMFFYDPRNNMGVRRRLAFKYLIQEKWLSWEKSRLERKISTQYIPRHRLGDAPFIKERTDVEQESQ